MTFDLTTRIGKLLYDEHALMRMEERNIFPSVIENALENGENYRFPIRTFGESKGATQLYLVRNSAYVKTRKEYHLFVLTDSKNVVRTTYVGDNRKLRKFKKKNKIKDLKV